MFAHVLLIMILAVPSSLQAGALSIKRATETSYEASFSDAGVKIKLLSSREGESFRARVMLNSKPFDVFVAFTDAHPSGLGLDGYGQSVSEEDRQALRSLLAELEPIDLSRGAWSKEATLHYAVGFLAASAHNYEHHHLQVSHRLWEGITCVHKGERRLAVFDDRDGHPVTDMWWDIGHPHSKTGQCGSDGIETGWTVDCFNHDMCHKWTRQQDLWELPGGTGPHCADEFAAAIDDFFFSLFWGCTGQ